MCFLYDWWMTRIKILVVEMAGYYLSSVFCVVMDRVEVDVHYNEKKGTRLISVHQKRFYYTAQIF